MNKVIGILAIAFLFTHQLKAYSDTVIEVPTMMTININNEQGSGLYNNPLAGTSKLSATLDMSRGVKYGLPTEDYKINGGIFTNCSPTVCNGSSGLMVEVAPLVVSMINGTSEVKVHLRGYIGGKAISTTAQAVALQELDLVPTLPWVSTIQIIGDIDETSVGINDRPGEYFGSFTIKATKQ